MRFSASATGAPANIEMTSASATHPKRRISPTPPPLHGRRLGDYCPPLKRLSRPDWGRLRAEVESLRPRLTPPKASLPTATSAIVWKGAVTLCASCRLMHYSKVRILVAQMLRIGFALRELSADPSNAS